MQPALLIWRLNFLHTNHKELMIEKCVIKSSLVMTREVQKIAFRTKSAAFVTLMSRRHVIEQTMSTAVKRFCQAHVEMTLYDRQRALMSCFSNNS